MYVKGKWNKNEYRLVEKIGSGNFGSVFKGLDKKGRIRAIKISKDILSITNESNAMERLKGMAFIPRVYDFDDWEINGNTYHFIVMDYIDGYNLKELSNNKRLNSKSIFKIGKILINILGEVNRLGYKYTDIKLENIILDKRGNIYFVDFGSLVEKDRPTREYTPTYNIYSWGLRYSYNNEMAILFSVAMIMITLIGKKVYNPLIHDLEEVIRQVNTFPIKKAEKQLLVDVLKGRVRTLNQYKMALSALLDYGKSFNGLNKIDYILIASIVSFVFIIILGVKSIFY
ncbi:MAG: protein kinase [Tissierellia bacterium]|nr:protein kinase [Tissierellia bacterium]